MKFGPSYLVVRVLADCLIGVSPELSMISTRKVRTPNVYKENISTVSLVEQATIMK